MSITTRLPRLGLLERSARAPRHRAVDEVARLRHQLAGAEIYMAGQRVQIDDAETERDEARAGQAEAEERRDIAEKALDQAEATIRLRDQQIAELVRRLQVGVLAEAAAAKTQELDVTRLRNNYAPEVLTLQQAHCIGPVLDPGRIS